MTTRTTILLLLAASVWPFGCGGGSPSDIILPEEVTVSLSPLGDRSGSFVALELAATSGRDVGIEVVGVDLQRTTGVAFELTYDASLLEFVAPGPGTFFAPAGALGASVVEAEPGRLVGVAASSDQASGRSGTGTLLTLQFRLKQLRDAETPLIFEVPASLVYGPEGATGPHTFLGSRLITRIRAPE